MCGIFGAVDLAGFFSPADCDRFVSLTDLVSYRGPDASGYKTLQVKSSLGLSPEKWDVFLGHRRLAIIDLSDAGRQPMTDNSGRWLVFNGEIFNFVELRRELQELGDCFQTQTDSEVILHIYRRYGIEGFAKLNGMWAFALVDLPERRMILSRDRFSIKPLYYTRQGSRLYFGSEIKQLLPLLPVKELNHEAMNAFLSQLLLDHNEDTFFGGIHKVAPKTSLVISLSSGQVSRHRYWDYSPEPVANFDEAAVKFRELLEDSVRIRLRSDVRVGCLLSGGLDSSAVATICHGLGADNVETFSVVSGDERYSEGKFIDLVTAKTGVTNRKLWFEFGDALGTLDEVLKHSDEPVAGFSVVAQYKIFQLVRQHSDVTVLLSGQGGDEILLGYLKFFFLYVRGLIQGGRLAKAAEELLASLLRGTVLRQFEFSQAQRYLPWRNSRPLGGALSSASQYSPWPIWQGGNLRERQKQDIDRYSVPALAHYEDRNSMAHSLEVRHPFLDHRLVNYAVALPMDFKIRNGWTKYILRKSLTDLPTQIAWRKDKQGFTTAEAQWIREDFQPVVRRLFRKSQLHEMGILDQAKFMSYYDRFLKGHSAFFLDVCRALIAEIWTRNVFGAKEDTIDWHRTAAVGVMTQAV